MAIYRLYADLVEAGLRSLDGAGGVTKVPTKYLEGTLAELTNRGYFKETEEPKEEL